MTFKVAEWLHKVNLMKSKYREINSFFDPIFNESDGFIWEYLSWFPHESYGFPDDNNITKLEISEIFQQLAAHDKTLNIKEMHGGWLLGTYVKGLSIEEIKNLYSQAVIEIEELESLFKLEFEKHFSCDPAWPHDYYYYKDIFTNPYLFAPYEEDRKRIDVIECYSRIEKISCLRDFFCRDLFLSVFIMVEEILKDYYENLFFYNPRLMINYSKDTQSLMRKVIDSENKEDFLLEMAKEIANSIIGNKRSWLKDLSGKSAVDHEQRSRKMKNSQKTSVRLSQSLEEAIKSLTEIRNQVAHEGYDKLMSEILNDFQPYEIKSRDFNAIDKLFYKGELLSVTFIVDDLLTELAEIAIGEGIRIVR